MSSKNKSTPAPSPAPELKSEGTSDQSGVTDTKIEEEGQSAPQPDPMISETPSSTTSTEPVAQGSTTEPVSGGLTDIPEAVAKNSKLQGTIESLLATGSAAVQIAITGMRTYASMMAPGVPQDANTINAGQLTLWRTIKAFAESDVEDWNAGWSVLLDMWVEGAKPENERAGVFSERYVYRGMSSVTLTEEDLRGFQNILTLISVTADSAGRRDSLSQVSPARSVEKGFTEQARQRILNFYGM